MAQLCTCSASRSAGFGIARCAGAANAAGSAGTACASCWLVGCLLLAYAIPTLCVASASLPEARAGCGNSARPDPWRGCWATGIPTPTLWSILDRQADVALGQRGSGRMRAHQIFELGALDSGAELARVREAMQDRRHPPRESLGQPDAAQAQLRVPFQCIGVAASIKSDQRARQVADVAGCQIQPFG